MRDHLAYLKYVLRHKLFVLMACPVTGASLWRGLVHDLSKFSAAEWGPYVHCFYKPDGSKQYNETPEFSAAWNAHQKYNPHHWQYWLLTFDRGETVALPMPDEYIREMVADWLGAGRAITGRWDGLRHWYDKNKEKIKLHPDTRQKVEALVLTVSTQIMLKTIHQWFTE